MAYLQYFTLYLQYNLVQWQHTFTATQAWNKGCWKVHSSQHYSHIWYTYGILHNIYNTISLIHFAKGRKNSVCLGQLHLEHILYACESKPDLSLPSCWGRQQWEMYECWNLLSCHNHSLPWPCISLPCTSCAFLHEKNHWTQYDLEKIRCCDYSVTEVIEKICPLISRAQ